MGFTDQKIPAYIYEKGNTIRLVSFTALFALIFINIYKPFSSFSWYKVSEFKFFLFSSMIILTGLLVVAISRGILYYWGKKHSLGLGQYLLWIICELFFMSLFYTIYTVHLNPERDYMVVFRVAAVNTLLVILLPYVALHYYFAYKDALRRLQYWENKGTESLIAPAAYSFHDENGELRLSVAKENLLYIESADNYVNIWYLHKDVPEKLMLRNSMKAMEKALEHTPVVRCHRSYMVNLDEVKVIRRQKNGAFMEFGIDRIPDIPVSGKYDSEVTKRLSH